MGIEQDQDDNTPVTMDGGASPVAPCPTGPGGNYALLNQDEGEIIERSYEDFTISRPMDGYDESDAHVQGVFRMPGL